MDLAWVTRIICDSLGSRVYLMEAYDVDHPGTEACSGGSFLSDKLRVKLWVTEVLVSHTPHRGFRDMLFVKVHQSLQEIIHLNMHLCGLDKTMSHYIIHAFISLNVTWIMNYEQQLRERRT